MLTRELRNQLALRKLIRIATRTALQPDTTQLWNVHIHGLDIEKFDYVTNGLLLTKLLLKHADVMCLVDELHSQSNETVLEDLGITTQFIERCKELM